MKMMHTGGKASREKGGGRMMEWAKKVARAFSGETGTDEECRQSMKDRFELIRSVRFPKLEHVTSQDIAAMDKGDYVIVDVRPQRERDVSFIPGSIAKADFSLEDHKNKLIIPSCTIGGRSGDFARELLKQNPHLRVKNHAGSLMDWCHEGYGLVDGQGASTKAVHAYGKSWVKFFPQQRGLAFVVK
eukprot:CAMPEP_0198242532 /NCGR_PEP_ID=MMETSP1446-20131203/17268_1 /TAXON_ID=1461542 ORGANISM="Unidentified sp, Strain CCMP2111" /NCGR_SAMPLE_ID=MMETSP1446 /ASSEMBLY_ACC=CAM_ASM_001112 /LENGTH=186 /DNA_ID=CAMNT_0043926045 /DNA_START=1 /DNA_END=561 /DNA_ORIENTATION=+